MKQLIIVVSCLLPVIIWMIVEEIHFRKLEKK